MVIYQKPTNRNNLLNFDVLLRHQTILIVINLQIMDKNNLSKKVGLLLAGCFITFNALGQTDLDGNSKLDNVKD